MTPIFPGFEFLLPPVLMFPSRSGRDFSLCKCNGEIHRTRDKDWTNLGQKYESQYSPELSPFWFSAQWPQGLCLYELTAYWVKYTPFCLFSTSCVVSVKFLYTCIGRDSEYFNISIIFTSLMMFHASVLFPTVGACIRVLKIPGSLCLFSLGSYSILWSFLLPFTEFYISFWKWRYLCFIQQFMVYSLRMWVNHKLLKWFYNIFSYCSLFSSNDP